MIYQSLDDLKVACLDAIEGETQITDFEVGVFSGKYQTEVPVSYFEHLSELRAAKGRKRKTTEDATAGTDSKKLTLVGNGAPVNMPSPEPMTSQEDIRYAEQRGVVREKKLTRCL